MNSLFKDSLRFAPVHQDRLGAGLDSIRDCIAFPKNNSGRDVMLDAPGQLDDSQLEELCLKVDIKE